MALSVQHSGRDDVHHTGDRRQHLVGTYAVPCLSMGRNPNICEQEFPLCSPVTGGPLLGWSRLGALWESPWRTA